MYISGGAYYWYLATDPQEMRCINCNNQTCPESHSVQYDLLILIGAFLFNITLERTSHSRKKEKKEKIATQRNYSTGGNTGKHLPWALVGVVVIYLCHDIMAYCRLFLYVFSFGARLSLVCVNSTSSSSGGVYISPCS